MPQSLGKRGNGANSLIHDVCTVEILLPGQLQGLSIVGGRPRNGEFHDIG